MVGATRLLRDSQGTLIERLSFDVAALNPVELYQVIQACGNIEMGGTERPLPNGQSTRMKRLGLGSAALPQ